MEILWLAIVLYSVGLGLVLHFKPASMFHENGAWKEFGYQRSPRTTLFPFWLFAISWAFASYAIAAAATWTMVVPAAAAAASFGSGESEGESEEEIPVVPKRGRGRPRKSEAVKPREGYYVVDPASEESGLRKYIYYGSNPPEES
jgi:hypothetical protein